MKEVLITSGTSFEGYEIVDYGHISSPRRFLTLIF